MLPPALLERDHSSVTLKWELEAGATHYELQMADAVYGADEAVWISLTTALTSGVVKKRNLAHGRYFNFRVRVSAPTSLSTTAFSLPSDDLCVLSPDFRLMDAPVIQSKDINSVTLAWNRVPGVLITFLNRCGIIPCNV